MRRRTSQDEHDRSQCCAIYAKEERGADCAAAPPNAKQVPIGSPPHVEFSVAAPSMAFNSTEY